MSKKVENCSQGNVVKAFRPLTLIELLHWRARNQPCQKAYTFLKDGDVEASSLTYEELDRQARAVAVLLQELGARGERVLLLYPPGLEYIAAFFGCLYAGMVAVPAYPPDPSKFSRSLPRLQSMVADAQATIALTAEAILSRVKPMLDQSPLLQSLNWASGDNPESGIEDEWRQSSITGGALALLQYTSGSTGTPKGVMLSHSNLLHNAKLVYHSGEHTPNDCYVSWLPVFHDMGFMVGILQPLYAGVPVVSMSPVTFLQRPLLWLKAISRYRATISGGPNFAYDLCVRKIAPEQRHGLDLSSWSIAFNGAEPIRHETLDRFTEAFAPCGFRRQAFYPCYGLAEATLIVSGGAKSAPPVVSTFQAGELRAHLALETNEEHDQGRVLVGCGKTLLEQKIVIVNPESLTECPPNEVGEIWVSGGSIAQGYWNSQEETARTFRAYLSDTGEGPFLRTGDHGFLNRGELYVTGRLKDLIIIRGLNHYPLDIELSVERSHPALRQGCGAAFSVEIEDDERLVVVQEIEYRQRPDIQSVIGNIHEAVVQQHEIHPYAVVLIKPGRIPKTTSGKIQRRATRQAFLSGDLEVIGEWRDQTSNSTHGFFGKQTASIKGVEAVANLLASEIAFRLGCDPASVDLKEPLARYGIDSLWAIELIHLVETRFGVILSVSSLLQSSSIAELSFSIAERRSKIPAAPALLPAPREERLSAHPLSHGQKALWFFHQLTPESPAYNISSAARIRQSLDPAALRRAFQIIVERHPSLRTRFASSDGQPVQEIRESGEISFSEIDASAMRPEEFGERLVVEANLPFDLENGPLFRVNLYRRATDEYVLLLSVHHIAVDFWSLAIIMKELGILYTAERIGVRITLPSAALQYTDYVRWQAEMLAGPEGERLRNYWLAELPGALSSLDLPTDRPRPKIQTYRGDSFSFKLDSNLTSRLKEIGQASEATLYMTLLAAFHVLLSRYANQERFVVGSPTACRSRADLAGLVGYVVNLLVLRADLSGNPIFNEYLKRLRGVVLGVFDHQEYPFPLLVEQLQPKREVSHSPIVEAVFTWQKAQAPAGERSASFALGENGARLALGELQLESLALAERVAQFDLTMMMSEEHGSLAGSLQFNSDLFDRKSIERCAGHFQTLIQSITRNPQCRVSDLELISEAERRQLLEEWNATEGEYPKGRCVHELYAEQAKRNPERIALIGEGGQLSYGELERRANQLGRYLQRMGVGPEVVVGLCLERSVEMVVSMLGALKAGGAYLPLDPEYQLERLSFMLADGVAGVVVTRREIEGRLPASWGQTVLLDEEWERIGEESEREPESWVESGNLAYLIYTSGSTGRPKGVAIPHRAVLRLVINTNYVQLDQTSCLLQLAPQTFDAATFEMWGALLNGGRLVIPEVRAPGAADLGQIIDKHGVETMWLTASLYNVIVDEGVGELRGLKQLLTGGEALSVRRVRVGIEQLGSTKLINGYGPTEGTTFTCCHEIGAEDVTEWKGRVPIGRPIANTKVYVMDEWGQLSPLGVVGELYIGGDGLARCYYNRSEATAEKFVPHPYSEAGGERLYRTGDKARYLSDGRIDFVGRADDQVKVRGYRVELGEIEAALNEHTTVKQSLVVVSDDGGGGKRLLGYVVAEARATATALKRYLRERLPEYMVPNIIVFLEEMPVTANGKIDRRRLQMALLQSKSDRQADQPYVAPRTPVEGILVGIFEEVLRVDQVGREDDFFEIGGHSLLATQVVSRVRSVFGMEIGVRSIFEKKTAAGVARRIEDAMRAGERTETPPLVRVARESQKNVRAPLSFPQQRLWFIDQLEPASAVYNIPGAVRLKGELDVKALEAAINEIVRRHESLRTRFEVEAGGPVQVIDPWEPRRLDLEDLTSLPGEEREQEARRIGREEAGRGFDLRRGPLLRVKVLKLEEEQHIVFFTMHHIVSDGWSLGILIRELGALYRAYNVGEESPLAELPIQYADFAVWQRQWLKGEALERELEYWRKQLAGVEALKLPTDHLRPAVESYRGAQQLFVVDSVLTAALKALNRQEGVTSFMTLLAAFQTLLYLYTGQADIMVGTPAANRNRLELEGLIGFFVNTLVMRTRLSSDLSFRELLHQVRETALAAYSHDQLPFDKLIVELSPKRAMGQNPLFQVWFFLENTSSSNTMVLPGITVSPVESDFSPAKLDLALTMTEQANGITGTFTYAADLFESETINTLAKRFRSLLQALVSSPDCKLFDIPLMGLNEGRQMMETISQIDELQAPFVF